MALESPGNNRGRKTEAKTESKKANWPKPKLGYNPRMDTLGNKNRQKLCSCEYP